MLQLLTPLRSLLTTVFYAQILKLKLHLPDSAALHRQVSGRGCRPGVREKAAGGGWLGAARYGSRRSTY